MLVPVLVHVNHKITSQLTLTLEDLLGVNLPLLFPSVRLMNRTPDEGGCAVSGVRRTTFTAQTDADFEGAVDAPIFSSFSLGAGQEQLLAGLPSSGLLPDRYGINHELTLANAGPAEELRVSLLVAGFVETSVSPDPYIVVNV